MTNRFPTLAALNLEWNQLAETSADMVSEWALIEPALAGCGDLDDVLAASQRQPDAVFAALLRRGRNHTPLAHRVILQALLGLLVRLANGRPDVFEEAVGEAWVLIVDYPLERRPRSIVANLAWALRRWAAERSRPAVPAVPDLADHREAEPEPDAAATLARARELGLIDHLTHRTLASVYLAGLNSAQAGRELGMSAQAVRWRCSHALRTLHRQAALLAG